jgi:hypothetical protein
LLNLAHLTHQHHCHHGLDASTSAIAHFPRSNSASTSDYCFAKTKATASTFANALAAYQECSHQPTCQYSGSSIRTTSSISQQGLPHTITSTTRTSRFRLRLNTTSTSFQWIHRLAYQGPSCSKNTSSSIRTSHVSRTPVHYISQHSNGIFG